MVYNVPGAFEIDAEKIVMPVSSSNDWVKHACGYVVDDIISSDRYLLNLVLIRDVDEHMLGSSIDRNITLFYIAH